MNEDKLLKKIQLLIKEEIRAVKDLVEITKKKVESQELHIYVTTENVRSVKEQQSVMNEKLDGLAKTQVKHTKVLEQHTNSLLTIESTIKVYSDMYKLNNDNMKKLEKRLEKLEDNYDITPNPEHTLANLP